MKRLIAPFPRKRGQARLKRVQFGHDETVRQISSLENASYSVPDLSRPLNAPEH